MTARFGGMDESQGAITCKISSDILEPFFGMKPVRDPKSVFSGEMLLPCNVLTLTPCFIRLKGDLRKLSREDRALSEVVVREGGKKVQELTQQLQTYEITMDGVLADDFFECHSARQVDGDRAVLWLKQLRS